MAHADWVPAVVRVAFASLGQRKLRTFLTALGLVIGVGAVVTMVSAGQAAKAQVQGQIDGLGTNLLIITPGFGRAGGVRTAAGSQQTLTIADAEAVATECLAIACVSPTVRRSAPVAFGNKNWTTSVQGCNAYYLPIRDWQVQSGAAFTTEQVRSAAKVCLLGEVVARELFDAEDPVGKTLRIRKFLFRVVGVLESKGQSGTGQDQDDMILAPFTTVLRLMAGTASLDAIIASAHTAELVEPAKSQIEELLARRHSRSGPDNVDFTVRSQGDLSDAAGQAALIMTVLLGGIASVSLLVGGIGIMNIMLVSVRERTREIGIRMAVGARGRDILLQFLTEAVTVCILGGVPGAVLGWLGAFAISHSFGWPVLVSASSFALALGFSIGIGLFFGIYPAWRASRLDPVEALRYE